MPDGSITTSSTAALRVKFAAVVPRNELQAADDFLAAVNAGKLSPEQIGEQGRKIEKALTDKTTLFEFNFAQILAQENDDGRQVEKIADQLQHLENTTAKLRATLHKSG